jgi:hypothetical protein
MDDMIISHRYKFIFMRTEKTAGSSLSTALTEALGEDVTATNLDRPGWAKYSPIHHGALKRHLPQYFGLHSHATAKQARRVLGDDIFNSYYKFAVERNPWDRQVSLYTHRQTKTGRSTDNFDKDMRSFIYRNTEYVRLNNWAIYAIGDKVVVDELIDYDNLDGGLSRLFERLKIKVNIKLPRLRSYKSDRPHYSTVYSDVTKKMVAKWYKKEIDYSGYHFETA